MKKIIASFYWWLQWLSCNNEASYTKATDAQEAGTRIYPRIAGWQL